MTKKEFNEKRWGNGMVVLYRDQKTGTQITAPVISVDFESSKIGVELPPDYDIVFLPCEWCEIIKDFVPKTPKKNLLTQDFKEEDFIKPEDFLPPQRT